LPNLIRPTAPKFNDITLVIIRLTNNLIRVEINDKNDVFIIDYDNLDTNQQI
jgi:hypothetical protein